MLLFQFEKLLNNVFTAYPVIAGQRLTHGRIVTNRSAVNGEIINLGTDEVNTTQDGINAVEQIMNKKLIIDNKPPRKGDQQRTEAVIDKARKLLNYEPKVTLKLLLTPVGRSTTTVTVAPGA